MLCAVCQKKADTRCSACSCVHYCSRECQKSNWKIHKKFCNSFVIKEEEEEKDGLKSTRRSLFAATDLERGSYILEEMPWFQIARAPWPEKEKKYYEYCITCGTNMFGFLSGRCSKCKWPVCVEFGKNCQEHKIHTENECEILVSKQIDYDSLAVHEDRRVLLILRAGAVKEKNPELWAELIKRADEFSKSGQDSVNNREEISKLEDAMKKLEISNDDMKMYKKFFQLLNLTSIYNEAHSQRVDLAGEKGTQAQVGDFLYPLSSYFSFSCAPNCNFAIEDYPDFKIQVRAARDIKKGEELTIHYPLIPLFQGTIERRRNIKERFGYLCQCVRCSDPTEFGTFFSGTVCNDCRPEGENKHQLEDNVGYFLPVDHELKEESESKGEEKDDSPLFQCNRCKTIHPYSFLKDKLNINGENLTDDDDETLSPSQNILNKAENLKLILSKFSEKIVHPNHFKIHKIQSILCKLYSDGLKISSANSEDRIQRKDYYEGLVHFLRLQEELERKLLNGAVMYEQAHDQETIAGGLYWLAQIQSESSLVKNVRLLLDIMEKLKECIKYHDLAIDFQTTLMPTTFKPPMDLDFIKSNQKMAREMLSTWYSVYQAIRSSYMNF